MLNIYDYPDVHAILLILTSGIFNGNDRLNENTAMRGYALLTPRSREASKDLQKFLHINNVKFQIMTTPFGEEIKFKYGQNERIDDTVLQMYDDDAFRRVNDMLNNVHNHKMPDPSIEELKGLITRVDEVKYNGETAPSHYYFYSDDIERMRTLMVEFSLWVEKHVSYATGQPVQVLRLRMDSVGDGGRAIIEELKKAAKEKQDKNPRNDFAQGADKVDDIVALEQLKGLIQGLTRLPREQELAHPDKLFYCFHFDASAMDKAQRLLKQLGISTEKSKDGNGKEFLLYSVKHDAMSEDIVDIIYTLDMALTNKSARAAAYVEAQKSDAIDKLKKMVINVQHAYYEARPDEYYYFWFPIDKIDEAQELMARYVGVVPEKHISHAGKPDEKMVLRFRIDDNPAMKKIEDLMRELSASLMPKMNMRDRNMEM